MIAVRLEEPRDREVLLEVERQAFGSDEEPAIVEEVRDEEGSFALVADDDGEVVGHVQFSRARIGDVDVVALGPIGVRPDRQGDGIGSTLVRDGLAEASPRGEIAAILVGDPGFYPRFGFEPGSSFDLRNPFAGLDDGTFAIAEEDFMVAPLGDRAHVPRGPVRGIRPSGSLAVEARPGGA